MCRSMQLTSQKYSTNLKTSSQHQTVAKHSGDNLSHLFPLSNSLSRTVQLPVNHSTRIWNQMSRPPNPRLHNFSSRQAPEE